jgi:hypothetical protein
VKLVRRWLVNGLAAISLLLCFGIAVLWWRSYRAVDELYGYVLGRSFQIDSFNGCCQFHVELPRALKCGVDPNLNLYRTADPFQYVVYSPDPWQPQVSSIFRARWPIEMTEYCNERSLLLPPPRFQTWLARAKEGPTRYLKVLQFQAPFWTACFPASIGFAVLIPRLLRRRSLYGLCVCCGYDLRATPDRCPECGTIPPKK